MNDSDDEEDEDNYIPPPIARLKFVTLSHDITNEHTTQQTNEKISQPFVNTTHSQALYLSCTNHAKAPPLPHPAHTTTHPIPNTYKQPHLPPALFHLYGDELSLYDDTTKIRFHGININGISPFQ